MAPEGTEQVVEQPGGASPTTDAAKPNDTQPVETAAASGSGAQPVKSRDYDREIAGFKADLQKERAERQKFAKDLAEARAETERERKRARLLFEENPQSDKDKEEEEIRARLKSLGVPTFSQEDLDAFRAFKEQQASMQETTQHYWIQHGRTMVGGVVGEIEKELGGKLSDRQVKRIQAEYAREAENNPEFLARHEAGDKTLISEFAKQLSEDWFEPARRRVTQQETQRYRAVPSGKDRGIVTTPQQKIDVNDPKAVEDLLVKSYREKHGDFTGRK